MKIKRKLIAYVLAFAMVLGMIPAAGHVSAAKKARLSNKKITVAEGKSKTVKVRNTTKKVAWKILSGEKCIALRKKGKTEAVVRGKKKGTAVVQAKTGKTKLICIVTVKHVVWNSIMIMSGLSWLTPFRGVE